MIIKRFSVTDKFKFWKNNNKINPWIKFISWLIPTLGLGTIFKKYLGGGLTGNMFVSAIITSSAYFLLDNIATKRKINAKRLADSLNTKEKLEILKKIDETLEKNLPKRELDKIVKASKYYPTWGDGDEYLCIKLFPSEDIAKDIIEHPGEKHLIFYLSFQDPESCFSYDGKYWYYSYYEKAPYTKLNWNGVIKKIDDLLKEDLPGIKSAVSKEDYEEAAESYNKIIDTLSR